MTTFHSSANESCRSNAPLLPTHKIITKLYDRMQLRMNTALYIICTQGNVASWTHPDPAGSIICNVFATNSYDSSSFLARNHPRSRASQDEGCKPLASQTPQNFDDESTWDSSSFLQLWHIPLKPRITKDHDRIIYCLQSSPRMFTWNFEEKTQHFITRILPELTELLLLKHALFIRKQGTAPTKKAASFSTGDASSLPIEREIYQAKNPYVTGGAINVGMGHCWNDTDRYKSIYSAKKKTCPSAKTLSTTNPTRTGLGSKPDVFCKTPTTIRVSRGTDRTTGRTHSTIWFFYFSVQLRIDELCKQPEKMMVHLCPIHVWNMRSVNAFTVGCSETRKQTSSHQRPYKPEISVSYFNTHHNTHDSEV